ncbi:hypothetical protein [Leptospira bouyouniensis]|uniref:hypothetical protein n=1 Tax=Leptospira bouyouniensis TaxID=2484911 RepID=UPI001090FC97|nr:hypothetical protein [Leptospira bouyouniensis]TGM85354.1 hypothetical protein EHQ99_06310 [Leptospira bouyouniensis]
MKRFILLIILSSSLFQCRIFKPSSLDPTEDLGSLQALLRFLALADAFNTQSQTVVFMKFTDANGTPYVNGIVEYSVINEADENGISVSPYGETGNVQTYNATLDAQGRAFLFFSERGLAFISLKDSGNNFKGSITFRIYNGITKQLYSILSKNGDSQFILEDLANYRNRLASNYTFTPVGSANGRQFIYFEVQTNFQATDKFSTIPYIASSSDGENYDQIIQIDGVNLERNVTYETGLEFSRPMFNGQEYVFFVSKETRTYPGLAYSTNENLVLRIPVFFPPSVTTLAQKKLPSGYTFFSDNSYNSWYYPALYLGSGRYMGTAMFSGSPHPVLLQLDSDNAPDLVTDFSCSNATPDSSLVAYQVISHLGINYLQCPTNAYDGQNNFVSKSLRIPDLISNQVTFDAVSPATFDSPTFPVGDQLVALLFSSPNYVLNTFPIGSYSSATPTITKTPTPISGINSSIGGGSARLRAVRSSNSIHYFLLSNMPTFSAPTIEIFRSVDGLSSVNQIIPSLPSLYSTPISNPEQLQSTNGKLSYSYAISAGIGIGSLPVYLTYFTRDDGSWEDLPKLIKIR